MQVFISLSTNQTYTGKKLFNELNEGKFFPKRIEGYWRTSPKSKEDLPFPVAFKVSGYDKEAFAERLRKVQARAKRIGSKGYSKDRWMGQRNYAGEFSSKGFKWPEGYITYIDYGVPPSRAFYKALMGEDLPNLPELREEV